MQSNTRQKLISLDFCSKDYALQVARRVAGLEQIWGFRVNEHIYHYGSSAVYDLHEYGRVFADIRLHDNLWNTKAIIRAMQAAGASVVSVYPTHGLDPNDFKIRIVEVGEYLFEDDLAWGELEVIHAHRFVPEKLAGILGIGAIDDKSVGTSGL